MNLVLVAVVQFLVCTTSAQRVRKFVAVMIYLSPLLHIVGVMGPTKSMANFSNASCDNIVTKGISSLMLGFPMHWQMSHFHAYSLAS